MHNQIRIGEDKEEEMEMDMLEEEEEEEELMAEVLVVISTEYAPFVARMVTQWMLVITSMAFHQIINSSSRTLQM